MVDVTLRRDPLGQQNFGRRRRRVGIDLESSRIGRLRIGDPCGRYAINALGKIGRGPNHLVLCQRATLERVTAERTWRHHATEIASGNRELDRLGGGERRVGLNRGFIDPATLGRRQRVAVLVGAEIIAGAMIIAKAGQLLWRADRSPQSDAEQRLVNVVGFQQEITVVHPG